MGSNSLWSCLIKFFHVFLHVKHVTSLVNLPLCYFSFVSVCSILNFKLPVLDPKFETLWAPSRWWFCLGRVLCTWRAETHVKNSIIGSAKLITWSYQVFFCTPDRSFLIFLNQNGAKICR